MCRYSWDFVDFFPPRLSLNSMTDQQKVNRGITRKWQSTCYRDMITDQTKMENQNPRICQQTNTRTMASTAPGSREAGRVRTVEAGIRSIEEPIRRNKNKILSPGHRKELGPLDTYLFDHVVLPCRGCPHPYALHSALPALSLSLAPKATQYTNTGLFLRPGRTRAHTGWH